MPSAIPKAFYVDSIGPFVRYQVTMRVSYTTVIPELVASFHVWRSDDNGATFYELDPTHAPTTSPAQDQGASAYYTLPGGDQSIIQFMLVNPATDFQRCIRFNLTSQLWDTSYTADSPTAEWPNPEVVVRKISGVNQTIIAGPAISGSPDFNFMLYDGVSAWTTFTGANNAGHQYFVWSTAANPVNNIVASIVAHFGLGGVFDKYQLYFFYPTNAVTELDVNPTNVPLNTPGNLITFKRQHFFIYSGSTPDLWVGQVTTVQGAESIVYNPITGSNRGGDPLQDYFLFLSQDGNTMYAIWGKYVTSGSITSYQIWWSSTTDGVTWTTPALYWDTTGNAVFDSVPFGSPQAQIEGASDLGNGEFGITIDAPHSNHDKLYNVYTSGGVHSLAPIDFSTSTYESLPFTVQFLCNGTMPTFVFDDVTQDPGAESDFKRVFSSIRTGGFAVGDARNWAPRVVEYDCYLDPPTNPAGFDPSSLGNNDLISGFSAGCITPALAAKQGMLVDMSNTTWGGGVSPPVGAPADHLIYSVKSKTIPPVPIDITDDVRAEGFFDVAQGCFWYSGAWWVIASPPATASGGVWNPNPIEVYKSTDDRVTWVVQDSANAPQINNGASSSQRSGTWAQRWDGVSNLIRVVYESAWGVFDLIEFDMLAGTWGSPHDPATLAVSPNRATFLGGALYGGQGIALSSNGDTHLEYVYQTSLTAPMVGKYTFLHSGVWSAPITTSVLTSNGLRYTVWMIDAHDRLHLYYADQSSVSPFPFTMYYQQITSGALGPSHTFPAVGTEGLSFDGIGHPIIDEANDRMYVPVEKAVYDSASPPNFLGLIAHCWVGETLATPTFTSEVINATGQNNSCTFIGWSPLGTAVNIAFQGTLALTPA